MSAATRDNEHYIGLQSKVAGTEKISVEEWMERAGMVVYMIAIGRQAEKDPADTQAAMDELLALMPEPLVIVSALLTKEVTQQ